MEQPIRLHAPQPAATRPCVVWDGTRPRHLRSTTCQLRHEFCCSWFRNGDVAKRVDANLADLRPLLKQVHEQCSSLSPSHDHSMFARAMALRLHNSWHVSFVVCRRCRCGCEPVGPTCHRWVGWSRSFGREERAVHLYWSCSVLQLTPEALAHCLAKVLQPIRQSFHPIPRWFVRHPELDHQLLESSCHTRPCEHETWWMLVEGCQESNEFQLFPIVQLCSWGFFFFFLQIRHSRAKIVKSQATWERMTTSWRHHHTSSRHGLANCQCGSTEAKSCIWSAQLFETRWALGGTSTPKHCLWWMVVHWCG